MNRLIFYSIVVLVLFGVDLTANRGAVTHDLTSALIKGGKTTQNAVYATAGFMTGRR